MRCAIGIFVALVFCQATSQSTLQAGGKDVRLGEAKAVDVGVQSTVWEPAGKAILYEATDADGAFQGVFRTDKMKGQEVLRLPPHTNIEAQVWLAQRPVILQAFSTPIPDKKLKRWSINVVDAEALTAKELWSWEYPDNEPVSVEVNASPSLDHALVTIHDAKGAHPYVLCDGASTFVLSTEMEAASKQGHGFAGWSADGTAYFGQTAAQAAGQTLKLSTGGVSSGGRADEEGVVVSLILEKARVATVGEVRSEFVLSDLVGKIRLMTARPTAPAAGIGVLEVMPWNGRIRSVRSRGPYVAKPVVPIPVLPRQEPARVVSGLRQGGSRALWLLPSTGKAEDVVQPGSLLISPDAELFWLPSNRSWVAYTMGGALFVRQIIVKA
jgi:hypothetical protein